MSKAQAIIEIAQADAACDTAVTQLAAALTAVQAVLDAAPTTPYEKVAAAQAQIDIADDAITAADTACDLAIAELVAADTEVDAITEA